MRNSTSQNWSGLKPIAIVTSLVVVLVLAVAPPVAAGSAKRWAGRGAAGGAIVGLITGGDLGSAAVGAAVGAGVGAAGGAISDSKKKKKAEKAELEELRQKEAERQAAAANDLPQSEEEWVAAIGQDNVSALNALIDCQHDRAALLAQAAATSENSEFRVIASWLGALTAIDLEESNRAEDLLNATIALDDEVDTMQQANLLAGEAMLEIKKTRSDEGISCSG